jgi:hypothetical protein
MQLVKLFQGINSRVSERFCYILCWAIVNPYNPLRTGYMHLSPTPPSVIHISLISTIVRVFTQQELASATNQSWCFPWRVHC